MRDLIKKPRSGGADADKSTRRGDRSLRRIVVIGVESTNPSKKILAWRRMRTSGERTSKVWTDGHELILDGRNEKTGTAGNGLYGYP